MQESSLKFADKNKKLNKTGIFVLLVASGQVPMNEPLRYYSYSLSIHKQEEVWATHQTATKIWLNGETNSMNLGYKKC